MTLNYCYNRQLLQLFSSFIELNQVSEIDFWSLWGIRIEVSRVDKLLFQYPIKEINFMTKKQKLILKYWNVTQTCIIILKYFLNNNFAIFMNEKTYKNIVFEMSIAVLVSLSADNPQIPTTHCKNKIKTSRETNKWNLLIF